MEVLDEIGIVVAFEYPSDGGHAFVFSLSPKFFIKHAIELRLPLKPPSHYSLHEQLQFAQRCVDIIRHLPCFERADVWIMHDKSELTRIESEPIQTKMHSISEYYGCGIATYFAWLQFYSSYLYVPSISGACLFFCQVVAGSIDCSLLPHFGLMMAIWGIIFTELWKRRNAELAFAWGVYGRDEPQTHRPKVLQPPHHHHHANANTPCHNHVILFNHNNNNKIRVLSFV